MTVTKIAPMLMEFRTRYPQGSLISELIAIDHGKYIVKVSVTVDGITLATALAGADRIETAEDHARDRALATLALDGHEEIKTTEQKTPKPSVTANAVTELTEIDNVVEPQSPAISVDLKKTGNNSYLASTSIKTTPDNSLESRSLPFPSNESQNLSPEMPTNPEVERQGADFSSNIFEQPPIAEQTETFSDWEIDTPSDEPPEPSSLVNPTETIETIEIDFNEIKNKTDVEIKRLGWTKEQGRDFLLKTYGKRSRLHLTDEELLDFLHYLESQPTA